MPRPWGAGVAFVTGAGGFVGRHVVSALAGAGWRTAAFGPRTPPRDDGLGLLGASAWFTGPVSRTGLAAAAEAMGPPALAFHAAGGASVGASLADPDADFAKTVGSLREMLAFLADAAADAKLVYPSSAAVYGSGAAGPIPETAALAPISPYGEHKLEAERLIAEAELDAVIIRFFSVYGPGLRKQLPWELAGRLAGPEPVIQLQGTGEEARDFLHVDDAVRLVGLAAGLPRAEAPVILNGGTGEAVTVRRMAETLRLAMGSAKPVGFSGQARAGDPASLVADIGRARALGFEPRVALDEGLAGFAAWARGALDKTPA
jgi:UDP-glucose 4-epimerase